MSPPPPTLLFSTLLAVAACATTSAPARRGAFAFHYAPSLSEEAVAWYSQFDILVTHDPLPPDQVQRLRSAGTRLVLYEWSVAFYETRANDWQKSLLTNGKTLLNTAPLTGGAGSTTAPAWYFDPASPGHAEERAAEIATRLRAIGYDGVFLDTTTAASVHPDARAEYEQRHPDVPYDVAYSQFLRALREKLEGGIIFTNQGYRAAEHYLPYVDWDLTESLITRPRGDGWEIRPWNDPTDPWNSIEFVLCTMIEPVAARYPHVRFGHLNYAGNEDRGMIPFVVATAQRFGGEAYVVTPDFRAEIDPVYFRPRAAAKPNDCAD